MKSVQVIDKIETIINLLIVLSLSRDNCADHERPYAVIHDFVLPALKYIQDELRDKDI